MKTTEERWQLAQKWELMWATQEEQKSMRETYSKIYMQLFGYDIEKDFQGKTILEIGCGMFPTALWATGKKKATVVDPLTKQFSMDVHHYWNDNNIFAVPEKFEYWNRTEFFDEVWLFNVLQHVFDPELLLERLKGSGSNVRVFECVDVPADDKHHPHMITLDLMTRVFPDVEKHYYPGGSIPNFHASNHYYFTANYVHI